MASNLTGDEGIGRRIAEARRAKHMTQIQLARLVPCSLSLIKQVEGGSRAASPSLSAGVARALGVSLGQLTGQPYDDSPRGRVHATIPGIQRAMLAWDLPDDTLPVRAADALEADVRTASRLGRRARYSELGAMLPALLDELSAACHSAECPDRARLFALLSEAYTGVTGIAYAVGAFDLRSQGMDRVQWAAQQSRDAVRIARTQWQRSTLFLQAASYERGLRLLERVRRDLDGDLAAMEPEQRSVYGAAHLRSAMFAARADDADTAAEHLEAAGEAARHAGGDRNDLGTEFGPTNVTIHRLAVAVELHAGAEIARLDGVRLPMSTAPVRAGRWYMDLASGWLNEGRRDKSLTALLQARKVSPQQTRNHPQSRETARALRRLERYDRESLASLTAWMGIS